MSQIYVSDENPNDLTGGKGCLGGGEQGTEDCVGPYVIFSSVETASNISPHAVLCSRCLAEAQAAVQAFEDDGQVIDLPPEDVEETGAAPRDEPVEVIEQKAEVIEPTAIPEV